MIKLIIFDLWKTLAIRGGLSVTSGVMKVLNLSMDREECRKTCEQSFQTKKYDSQDEACRQLCIDFGIKPTNELIENLKRMFKESVISIDLYPHTIEMLKQLKVKGYIIGLISNTSNSIIEELKQKTSLFEYIDYPLFSFNVGLVKPDLEIFKKMLKLSKCKPEEAIMIGDNPIDDVIPAKSLGMNAILYKDYSDLKKELIKFSIELN